MKYELLPNDTVQQGGRTLHRVRRLSDALLGGYVESEDNLAQSGNCFLFEKSRAFENARIRDDAEVYGVVHGDAVVSGASRIYGEIFGQAQILDHAIVRGRAYDHAVVRGEGEVFGQAYGHSVVEDHAKVFGQISGNARASGNEMVFGSKST